MHQNITVKHYSKTLRLVLFLARSCMLHANWKTSLVAIRAILSEMIVALNMFVAEKTVHGAHLCMFIGLYGAAQFRTSLALHHVLFSKTQHATLTFDGKFGTYAQMFHPFVTADA